MKKVNIFDKILCMAKDVLETYTLKTLLIFSLISCIISFGTSSFMTISPKELQNMLGETFSLFSSLVVIEIAFIAIFYSGSKGTEKAKEHKIEKENVNNYFKYLLVKNTHSISLKFLLLCFIYIIKIYGLSFKILFLNIGVHNIVYALAIYSFLITIDLVISMYHFLWGN